MTRAADAVNPVAPVEDVFWILDHRETLYTRMRYRTKRYWNGSRHEGV